MEIPDEKWKSQMEKAFPWGKIWGFQGVGFSSHPSLVSQFSFQIKTGFSNLLSRMSLGDIWLPGLGDAAWGGAGDGAGLSPSHPGLGDLPGSHFPESFPNPAHHPLNPLLSEHQGLISGSSPPQRALGNHHVFAWGIPAGGIP